MTDGPVCDVISPMNYSAPPAPLHSEQGQASPDYPPPLTAGNRVDFDTLDLGTDGVLSIDRLAFTFDILISVRETFRRMMHRMGFPRRGGEHYRESIEVDDPMCTGDRVLFQWAPYLLNSTPFVRVEFNPAKVQGETEIFRRMVMPFLRHGWASVHVTRIDVATDYGFPLQDHVYYAGNHKGNVYYSSEGIESLYLGSPKSNNRLRIYDKRKELASDGKPVPPCPWTRIEAQRRSTGLSAANVDTLPNPFQRLRIARPTPAGIPFRYLLYIKEAREHGIDSVMKRLKRCERRHLRNILDQMPSNIEAPSLVFAQDYKGFCRKRLPLFFEKGDDDGQEVSSREGFGAPKSDGGVRSGAPAI